MGAHKLSGLLHKLLKLALGELTLVDNPKLLSLRLG
jgi:hypothetical protein